MNSTIQSTDFRQYLQFELIRRCKKNPKYSLRAFAQFLEITPSHLSKIMNGSIGITEKKFNLFVSKLELDPAETEKFRARLKNSNSNARRVLSLSQNMINSTDKLHVSLDQFRLIVDWYHFAILELISLKNFKPQHKWVAQRLGISLAEANDAVERLQRLGFLEITPEGEWIDKAENASLIKDQYTDVAFQKMQKQILEMAILAMDLPLESRSQTSMTMAIDSELLPDAKNQILGFQRAFASMLQQKSKKRDHVYNLSISLYPVTRPETL